jgi:hypothetical protein
MPANAATVTANYAINTFSSCPDQKNYCEKSFFSPKEFSAHLNSSHFLTLDIAMQKVKCKIKPYFNYPEKNGGKFRYK